MVRKLDDKSLMKETYAASLQPEKLADFEKFWEEYIDHRQAGSEPNTIEDNFLKSHFTMALGIVERIRHDREEEDYFHRLVTSHPGFAIVSEPNGKVIAANSDADIFLDGSASIHGLPIADHDITEILERFKKDVAETLKVDNVYYFKDVKWGNSENATLLITLVNAPKSNLDNSTNRAPYYLISRIDLEVSDAILPSLQEKYSLTQSEAVIAMHLANGYSVKDIGNLRGTSEQTVRTQVKQTLAKTDTRDIADLVRLILSLAAKFNSVISQNRRYEAAQSDDKLTRVYNIIMPDGRYLEYIEQGHPNGRPVLYVHCITKGVRLTTEGAKKAVLKKWRIITPIRAGFSNSDQNLQKSPEATLNAAVGDYKFLLDHLGIKNCLLMSGWGGPFAQRLAISYPEIFEGLLQISCVPVWTKEQLNYFKTRHRVIVKTSFYAPAAAPYLLRVAKAMIDSGRSHLFVSQTDNEKENDIASLKRDPELISVTAEGYEWFFQQGVHSFLNEIKVIHTNWLRDTEKITMPVTVLHGDQIDNQPEKAFKKYFSALPHANQKVLKGAGIYMRYNHFDQVLEELEKLHSTSNSK